MKITTILTTKLFLLISVCSYFKCIKLVSAYFLIHHFFLQQTEETVDETQTEREFSIP